MKKDDIINGYRITQDFTTAGGGLSKWTFASKDGKEYFIKEFLAPTYPSEGSPGSAATKAAKRMRCNEFEAHHALLMKKLSTRSGDGGNLIITVDFFRYGSKYYKITDKVDVKGLSIANIAAAPWPKKRLILLTVAHSLRILHQAGVVHGDLKPDNILIKESAAGGYVAKLIDFDNSFVTGCPPVDRQDVVGDPVYYSPELLSYVKDRPTIRSADLQCKSDIFALGLIYCQFVTGGLPRFDRTKYQYACEAVNSGSSLKVTAFPEFIGSLINSMLHNNYEMRPTIEKVFQNIKSADIAAEGTDSSGKLGGTLLIASGKSVAEESRKDKVGTSTKSSQLTGTLIRKKP